MSQHENKGIGRKKQIEDHVSTAIPLIFMFGSSIDGPEHESKGCCGVNLE